MSKVSVVLGTVLTPTNGASLFNYWSQRQWVQINGRTYGKRASSYDTQCGGAVWVIEEVSEAARREYDTTPLDVDMVDNLRRRRFGVDDMFVHSECGITQVVIFAHPEDVPLFHYWYTSIEGQCKECSDVNVTTTEVIGYQYRGVRGVIPIHWTFHGADNYKHDEGACEDKEDYHDHDRWCPECEYEYVNNDGYCSECDDYVLDECPHWEDWTPPASETDDESLDCKEYDYVINEQAFDDHERYTCDHPGYLNLGFDEYPSKGLVTSFNLSRYGSETLCTRENVFDKLFMRLGPTILETPVFMSCNMGSPYGDTAWFIEQLQVRKDWIKETFGVEVTSPEHYATNPNMNYHYIDSLTMAVVNRHKFMEAVCHSETSE